MASECERIIQNMSPVELAAMQAMGVQLPADLAARAQHTTYSQIKAEQQADNEYWLGRLRAQVLAERHDQQRAAARE